MAARRLHHLIYITIANCCLFLIVCGIAIGTNKWFSASTKGDISNVGEVTVSYGLFNGVKTKVSLATVRQRYDLKRNVEEDFSLCIQPTEDDETVAGGVASSSHNSNSNATVKGNSEGTIYAGDEEEGNQHFLNFAFYLATLACLCLGMILDLVSGILALYNTYRTPSQPILSVYGLYFWNAISGSFVLLAMILWLIEFILHLRNNAAISDTLSGIQDTSGKGSLGVSFWILILPILFAMTNIAILMYRKWKIVKMAETTVRVMHEGEKDENGDTILF